MEKFKNFKNFKVSCTQSINEEFEQILQEGVYDQAIFKAVILQGPPGSGKDWVLNKSLTGHGLIEINSDKALEYLMDKEGLSKKMPASESEQRSYIRKKAKNSTELQQRLAVDGRNGLIINGTGDTVEKIKAIKDILDTRGYDSMMLAVNVSDDVSKQRNIERGDRGGRTVPEDVRKEKYNAIQKSKSEIKKMFGKNYIEFDNSIDLRSANPDIVVKKEQELMNIFKHVRKFVTKPHTSSNATKWIARELNKKDQTIPTHKSKLMPQVKDTMGLDYYGFGRYGKNHKVTHREVNGQLVAIPQTSNIKEESSMNFIKDKRGKIRKFKVRKHAAREAHQNNGEVNFDGSEYSVKLNKKIKEDINDIFESIDFGIESGMPLNSYSKEKLNKTGKVTVTELTGDETTASIGAQKEDELKKKGISLMSFRTKNTI